MNDVGMALAIPLRMSSSKYGGDNDFFLDLAIPWTTLEPLGFAKRGRRGSRFVVHGRSD